MSTTLYHNPRCSKSREALALLESMGVTPIVVDYLKTPPDLDTLRLLVRRLGVRPAALLRRKEPPFVELGLAGKLDDEDAILAAIAAHPVLLERPIVVQGERAVIARPAETLRTLFNRD